jgi:thiamine-phosphate pyrophosphorylase
MLPLAQCRLYTFVDTAYLRGATAASVAGQLCEGGSDLIQLRAKNWPLERIRQLAGEIGPILRRANVGFVLNDHWDIAQEAGADLCHLGQEDFFGARWTHAAQLPRNTSCGLNAAPLLGLSTHSPAQALRATAADPAYIAVGPVYATATKPAAPAVTLDYVRWAAAHVKTPWFAIGGITLETLDAVLEAGAGRICVVSAILNAPDIAATCRQFKRRITAATARASS